MPADLDLDAIEARAAKATPGPWSFIGGTEAERIHDDVMLWNRNEVYVANLGGGMVHPDDGVAFDVDVANASFIAHTRQDVPALVAALRGYIARERTGDDVIAKLRAREGAATARAEAAEANDTRIREVLGALLRRIDDRQPSGPAWGAVAFGDIERARAELARRGGA